MDHQCTARERSVVQVRGKHDKRYALLDRVRSARSLACSITLQPCSCTRLLEKLLDKSEIAVRCLITPVSLRSRMRCPAQVTPRRIIASQVAHLTGESTDVKGRDTHVAVHPTQSGQVEMHYRLGT